MSRKPTTKTCQPSFQIGGGCHGGKPQKLAPGMAEFARRWLEKLYQRDV